MKQETPPGVNPAARWIIAQHVELKLMTSEFEGQCGNLYTDDCSYWRRRAPAHSNNLNGAMRKPVKRKSERRSICFCACAVLNNKGMKAWRMLGLVRSKLVLENCADC